MKNLLILIILIVYFDIASGQQLTREDALEFMLTNKFSLVNESKELGIIGAKDTNGIDYTFYIRDNKWTGFKGSYLSHSINGISRDVMVKKWIDGLEKQGYKFEKAEKTKRFYSLDNFITIVDIPANDLHAYLILRIN